MHVYIQSANIFNNFTNDKKHSEVLIMEEMDAAINAASSPAVKIWMNWMLIIFLSSIIFVWKHKTAWAVLVTLLLSLPLAIYIFELTQSVPLIGLAHIALWLPLAIFLIITEFKSKTGQLKTPYGIYIALLLITIVISLFFDIRDAVLILFEMT